MEHLPRHLLPTNARFIVEATSPETQAFMRDMAARYQRACDEAKALAVELGAVGYTPAGGEPAKYFAFARKPEGAAWKVFSKRQADRHYRAGAAKSPEGDALSARMAACSPFPDQEDELWPALNLMHSLSYQVPNSQARGATSVGGGHNLAQACWIPERWFVSCFNPMAAIQRVLDAHPTAEIIGHTATSNLDDPQAWRPPEGWSFVTEAELDLIFAQHRVDEERADLEGTHG